MDGIGISGDDDDGGSRFAWSWCGGCDIVQSTVGWLILSHIAFALPLPYYLVADQKKARGTFECDLFLPLLMLAPEHGQK